ncbi:MAG: glutamine-hydrolyzing GMP synthase, partial [Parcubacteria group bacterium]|nr:glutamine-hydrolyzing GMP synthase [Parcubacteria group bacterium]
MKNQIAILDFGSQYTHLIARRIRDLGVLSKIYTPNININQLKGVKGMILSGGPISVKDNNLVCNKKVLALNIPILGLCYGHQFIAHHMGGRVKSNKIKEYGTAHINILGKSNIFKGLQKKEQVWMSHSDSVSKLPQGFKVIAKTNDCPIAAMANTDKNIYGMQFHPETSHTLNGTKIVKNFIFNICKCKQSWSMDQYWQELEKNIKTQVGNKNVFLLVSGGVDSTVCFALLEKILGKKKVFGLHID